MSGGNYDKACIHNIARRVHYVRRCAEENVEARIAEVVVSIFV